MRRHITLSSDNKTDNVAYMTETKSQPSGTKSQDWKLLPDENGFNLFLTAGML